ncbi:C40 family peptidase [Christensenellaceae bacterium OttesenSCG-928-L17]|nr:C40 family peptidase [Christensenellaceae bacterium OttesenSCG-928-L17]
MRMIKRGFLLMLTASLLLLSAVSSWALAPTDVAQGTVTNTAIPLDVPKQSANGFADARTAPLSSFERSIVEQAFRLLPFDHPFVVAYERVYGNKIDTYTTVVDGVTLSGVPFQLGGKGDFTGFSDGWWTASGDATYPVQGLDCANFISWVYYQLGYTLPSGSATQFLSGKTGVSRSLPGVRTHKVIPTLSEAKVGDLLYTSTPGTYRSGDGSHIQLYIGTANLLGIGEELQTMIKHFPADAHLVMDCGWSDGIYYFCQMKKLGVENPRVGMGGVGVQFVTSIHSGSTALYESPGKTFTWKHPETLVRFYLESRLEKMGRPLQHDANADVMYPMNLSRPVVHPAQ